MRFVGIAACVLLAAGLGAIASLYLAMQLGGLVSSYEPGGYLGVVLAVVAVPVGGLSAGWVAAVVASEALARRSRPSA